ncbi:hypothetical protein [Aquipuribacter hungaricus]|uniref:Secreted protein with PEP-CTERM sorting signal n=1 Tax=Aquipuribacter hungaricus TaxID=545624 RepID=A0ABV7WJN3_9MICO
MHLRGSPYAYLVVAVVLVLLAGQVPGTAVPLVLGALGVAAGVAGVVLLVRQGRDPNGPPGQH